MHRNSNIKYSEAVFVQSDYSKLWHVAVAVTTNIRDDNTTNQKNSASSFLLCCFFWSKLNFFITFLNLILLSVNIILRTVLISFEHVERKLHSQYINTNLPSKKREILPVCFFLFRGCSERRFNLRGEQLAARGDILRLNFAFHFGFSCCVY